MGMYEDDRIRHKNALFEIVEKTDVICDYCDTEYDHEVDDVKVGELCPKCDTGVLCKRS